MVAPCPKPDFSTVLTRRHKWATGGWPPMSRACLNCGQTRAQVAASATLAPDEPSPFLPGRWSNITRHLSSEP